MTDRNRADRATIDLRKLSLVGQKGGWLSKVASRSLDRHLNELERILQAVPGPAPDLNGSLADLNPLFE
jgi:hypothetical protein